MSEGLEWNAEGKGAHAVVEYLVWEDARAGDECDGEGPVDDEERGAPERVRLPASRKASANPTHDTDPG